MANTTTIEWVIAVARARGMDARVWNPVRGCRPASDGCMNCWAARVADTRSKHPSEAIRARHEGLTTRNADGKPVFNGTVRMIEDDLTIPLRTKRPSVWFAPSEGDLFAEGVTDEMRDRVFAVMALTPQHTYQLLTKRPARMREYLASERRPYQVARRCVDMLIGDSIPKHCLGDTWPVKSLGDDPDWPDDITLQQWPLPNLWLGTTVENQATADDRIPHLLATPAAVRFLSCEPLLGPVDLRQWMHDYGCGCGWGGNNPLDYCPECGWRGYADWSRDFADCPDCGNGLSDYNACPECDGHDGDGLSFGPNSLPRIDWVIAGGESGPKARPMHPDWARGLRDQCAAAGVPFLFKQWGEWKHTPERAHFKDAYREPWARQESGRDGVRHALMFRVGKKAAGRLLDGVEHNGRPE